VIYSIYETIPSRMTVCTLNLKMYQHSKKLSLNLITKA